MITIKSLYAGYDGNDILRELNWNIRTGSINGLIGLNGSGKTTLLKCISKLLPFRKGSVLLYDQPVRRSEISFLETEPYYYHGITGREYLSLFNSGTVIFKEDEWAELLHLPLNLLVDEYSTGMKKKLSLLMIIKLNRSIILLDEPFNGLDLESSRILSMVLKQMISPAKVIIITSHIIGSLSELCSDIHFLSDGFISRTFTGETALEIEKTVFQDFDDKLNKRITELLS